MEGSYDRPVGVSLLAILLALGGGLLLITQLLTFGKINEASSELGLSTLLLQGGIGFLGMLGLAAGVGMWFVTRNVNVLITIPSITEQLGAAEQGVGMNYAKYGIRALWNGFLMFYLCRENPTSFFRTAETKKWKALLSVFAVCAVIFVIGSLLRRAA